MTSSFAFALLIRLECLSLLLIITMTVNIWKPYIWTVDKDINMKVIFNLLQICEVGGLLAQLVEHCTSIAEVMGSNPVQAWIFFRPSFHYCLSSVHNCEDRFHIHVFIRSSKLPVGLLAQLVEHCTGIAEVMGSNPIQAWIFFRPYFHYCSSIIH